MTDEDIIIEQAETVEEPVLEEKPVVKEEEKVVSNKEKLLTSLLTDDDEQERDIKHLKDALKVLRIDGNWFRRQIGVLVLIVLGIIWYITNRYQAQQEMIEEEKLHKELQDWKFRSMTRSSELTFRCRQSQLENWLKANGDTTLILSKTAPYVIKKD